MCCPRLWSGSFPKKNWLLRSWLWPPPPRHLLNVRRLTYRLSGMQPEEAGTGSGRALHTVTELARELGVTARTIRFYEDKGLIAPQRAGSTRVYTSRDRA